MTLMKWRPFREAQPSIWADDFFDLESRPFGGLGRFFGDLMPINSDAGATDVYEKNGNIITETNLSGFDPEKVDVEVEHDCIKISASFEDEKEDRDDKEGRKYYRRELVRKSLNRVIPLPSSVREKEAKAEYKDGVLTVTIPKNEQREKIKLKIKK